MTDKPITVHWWTAMACRVVVLKPATSSHLKDKP
jgi:hypothetical protein